MKTKPITKKEFSAFSEKLAQVFEMDIRNTKSSVSLEDIQGIEGVSFSRFKKASQVEAIPLDNMTIDSVNFYAETEKSAVFFLSKHFRNCSSHKDRIFHADIDGKKVIVFEDIYGQNATMRAILDADKWEKTFDGIVQEYKKRIINQSKNNDKNNETKNS